MEHRTGQFRHYDNFIIQSNGIIKHAKSGKKWKPSTSHQGNPRVPLFDGHKYAFYYLKDIIAEVFVPNPDGLPCVKHIDRNKLNNSADNLQWVANEEELNANCCLRH